MYKDSFGYKIHAYFAPQVADRSSEESLALFYWITCLFFSFFIALFCDDPEEEAH